MTLRTIVARMAAARAPGPPPAEPDGTVRPAAAAAAAVAIARLKTRAAAGDPKAIRRLERVNELLTLARARMDAQKESGL